MWICKDCHDPPTVQSSGQPIQAEDTVVEVLNRQGSDRRKPDDHLNSCNVEAEGKKNLKNLPNTTDPPICNKYRKGACRHGLR